MGEADPALKDKSNIPQNESDDVMVCELLSKQMKYALEIHFIRMLHLSMNNFHSYAFKIVAMHHHHCSPI